MDNDTVADKTSLVCAVNLALGDQSTGNRSDLRDLVYLANFHLTGDNLLDNLVEHTLHGGSDILDGIVDDRIGVDLYTLLVSELAGRCRRTHLEAHDESIRSVGKSNVAL